MVIEGNLGILSSRHLTYDPLIQLKVTFLLSKASVLRDGKISPKIPGVYSKTIFFKTSKYGDSSHWIIDFKNLSDSKNLSGLNDLNRYDKITDLNDLNSLCGL